MKQAQTRTAKIDEATGELKEVEEWVDVHVPVEVAAGDIKNTTSLDVLDKGTTDGPWYILYWLDQYHNLHPKIKEKIQQTNPKPVHFNDFSDSIACLLGIEFIKDGSVVPVSDIATNITGYTYNRVLDYILTHQNIALQEEMSIKVSNMFKYNMRYIKDDDLLPNKSSAHSHGKNLITDTKHYERMSDILTDLQALIDKKLGTMARVLEFIQSNVSKVEFFQWKNQFSIEESYSNVDSLGYQSDTQINSMDPSTLLPEDLPIN